MTYFDALTTLNLKENFTEEELKRSYRKLMKQYHPDLFDSASVEEQKIAEGKAKEINEAYDILSKEKVFDSKMDYINTLYRKLIVYASKSNNLEIKKYNKAISNIRKMFYLSACNINDKDYKLKIDKLYYEIIAMIKKELENFKQEFYSKNGLDESEIEESLNYECSLDEFYRQLLAINKKYNIRERLLAKIDREIFQYTNYVGYSKIKVLVNLIKNQTISKILKDEKLRKNFRDNEESLSIKIIINEMHDEIRKIFDTYYDYVKKINELKEKVEKINDDNIKNKFTHLEKEFNRGVSYSDVDRLLSEILKLIDDYVKKEEYKNKVMPFISKSYAKILSNYNKAIEKLASEDDFKRISIANKVFRDVLVSLEAICFGQIKIEALTELEKVDFLNDTKITQNLLLNTETIFQEKSGIYIRQTNIKGSRDILLGKVTEITNNSVILVGKTVFIDGKSKISLKEFEENYISIENFLENSNFIGKSRFGTSTIILYGNQYLKIFFNTNTKSIGLLLMNDLRNCENAFNNPLIEPYKDKYFMLNALINYVKDIVEKQINDYIYPDFKKIIK